MKIKPLIILLILSTSLILAQDKKKISEQEAINNSHIDFTTQYIYFIIHGEIEIDGHIFKNDDRECPIIFEATLDGVTIIDKCTNTKYTHRHCDIADCEIIHLTESPTWQIYIQDDNFTPFHRNDGQLPYTIPYIMPYQPLYINPSDTLYSNLDTELPRTKLQIDPYNNELILDSKIIE